MPGPIATAQVTTPPTRQKPNNPFYLQAEVLAAAGDRNGLEALDTALAHAGYDANGQVRRFIAASLAGPTDNTSKK